MALETPGLKISCVAQVEFKLPWREAGPPNHHDNKVDSDQLFVNNELSLCGPGGMDETSFLIEVMTSKPETRNPSV